MDSDNEYADESEEEIKEIPITKRQKTTGEDEDEESNALIDEDAYGSYGESGEDELMDAPSDDEKENARVNKKRVV